MPKPWRRLNIAEGVIVKVDLSDLKRVRSKTWRWIARVDGKARISTSVRNGPKVRYVSLGRFILKAKNDLVVTQISDDILDFRRSNLLACTMKVRQRKLSKTKKKCTSIYKGVSYVKMKKLWRAQIQFDYQSINLGDFEMELDAAAAYNRAARKYFGLYAFQNPVPPPPPPPTKGFAVSDVLKQEIIALEPEEILRTESPSS